MNRAFVPKGTQQRGEGGGVGGKRFCLTFGGGFGMVGLSRRHGFFH